MKLLKSSALILGVIVGTSLISCSDDDTETQNGENQISLDNQTYTLTDGIIQDYGSETPFDQTTDDSHYNFDFIVLDSDVVEIQDDGDTYIGAGPETTILVYIELFSPGATGFQAGTFNYFDESTTTQSDVDGEFFFTYGEVETDTDGVVNGDLDGPEYEVIGGSVTVVGSGTTDYTITFDLTLTGNRTLTGTYSGDFTYFDER